MNVRIFLVILFIILFALIPGGLNYSLNELTLEKMKNVDIVQLTPAGTVPHQVRIYNNEYFPIYVKKGTILESNQSQDLVIAKDDILVPHTYADVPAFCIEPETCAIKGEHLKADGYAPEAISYVISSTNWTNQENITDTQLKIWLLVRGTNYDPYSGESLAFVSKNNISYDTLQEKIYKMEAEFSKNMSSSFNIQNISKNLLQEIINRFKQFFQK